jgi:hypothetical protein
MQRRRRRGAFSPSLPPSLSPSLSLSLPPSLPPYLPPSLPPPLLPSVPPSLPTSLSLSLSLSIDTSQPWTCNQSKHSFRAMPAKDLRHKRASSKRPRCPRCGSRFTLALVAVQAQMSMSVCNYKHQQGHHCLCLVSSLDETLTSISQPRHLISRPSTSRLLFSQPSSPPL